MTRIKRMMATVLSIGVCSLQLPSLIVYVPTGSVDAFKQHFTSYIEMGYDICAINEVSWSW